MLHRLERLASLYMVNWSKMGGDRFKYRCELWYQFDEGKGSVCYDMSGNQRDGTLYGPQWRRGRVGQGLNFDGVDDYVAPPAYLFDQPSEFTAEFLIYIRSVKVQAFCKHGYKGEWGMTAEIGPPRLAFPIKFAATGWLFATVEMDYTKRWYHMCGVYKRGERMELYVDGGLKASLTPPDEPFYDPGPGYPFTIGAHALRDRHFVDGVLDEARFYSRALSAEEVSARYAYTVAGVLKAP